MNTIPVTLTHDTHGNPLPQPAQLYVMITPAKIEVMRGTFESSSSDTGSVTEVLPDGTLQVLSYRSGNDDPVAVTRVGSAWDSKAQTAGTQTTAQQEGMDAYGRRLHVVSGNVRHRSADGQTQTERHITDLVWARTGERAMDACARVYQERYPNDAIEFDLQASAALHAQ